jgi:dihydrofolate reductase
MLLGRVTYQEWADYWPTSTDEPFASHINNVPKYVVSKTLGSVQWGTWGTQRWSEAVSPTRSRL